MTSQDGSVVSGCCRRRRGSHQTLTTLLKAPLGCASRTGRHIADPADSRSRLTARDRAATAPTIRLVVLVLAERASSAHEALQCETKH